MTHTHPLRSITLTLGFALGMTACSRVTLPQGAPLGTSPSTVTASSAAYSSAWSVSSSVPFVNKLSTADLLKALQGGGYVIFFRHTKTDPTTVDLPKVLLSDCSTQKSLGKDGKLQAAVIAKAFVDLKIPVGKVYASEYCRAWETAQLLFGHYEKKAALDTGHSRTPDQVAATKKAVLPLLSAVPTPKKNTVLVSHDDVFLDATGMMPKLPGTAYIIKPDGKGSFDIVASLLVEDWQKLVK